MPRPYPSAGIGRWATRVAPRVGARLVPRLRGTAHHIPTTARTRRALPATTHLARPALTHAYGGHDPRPPATHLARPARTRGAGAASQPKHNRDSTRRLPR